MKTKGSMLASALLSASVISQARELGLSLEVNYDDNAANPRHLNNHESKSIFVSGTNGRAARLADCNMALNGQFSCIADAIDSYAEKNGIDRDDMLCWTVYKHEHNGVSLSTTPFMGGFDSCIAGFIFESKRSMREEFDVKRISPRLNKVIETRIQTELNQLCEWANSEVYIVSILDEDGDVLDEVEGCYNHKDTMSNTALDLIYEAAGDLA